MGNRPAGHGPYRVQRRRAALAALSLLTATVVAIAPPVGADEGDDDPTMRPSATWLSPGHEDQTDGTEMGSIRIPAIGLDETLRAGVAMSVINEGPAFWKGTSPPGGDGNTVIAGHRTTRSRPFYHLNKLEPGDPIVFTDGRANPAIYLVTETLIVEPTDIWITYETGESIVTLFACHPRGSARQRIVVRGERLPTMPLL